MGACSKASSETASWWHQGDECVVFSSLTTVTLLLKHWNVPCNCDDLSLLYKTVNQDSAWSKVLSNIQEVHHRQFMTSSRNILSWLRLIFWLCAWNNLNPKWQLQAVLATCLLNPRTPVLLQIPAALRPWLKPSISNPRLFGVLLWCGSLMRITLIHSSKQIWPTSPFSG